MRFSEAVLAGSTLARPRAGRIHHDDGSVCALGMGELSIGKKSDESRGSMFDMEYAKAWPWLATAHDLKCPIPNCSPFGDGPDKSTCYAGLVAHVFDYHVCTEGGCTLEQLVDYIRSVEPSEIELTETAQPENEAVTV